MMDANVVSAFRNLENEIISLQQHAVTPHLVGSNQGFAATLAPGRRRELPFTITGVRRDLLGS